MAEPKQIQRYGNNFKILMDDNTSRLALPTMGENWIITGEEPDSPVYTDWVIERINYADNTTFETALYPWANSGPGSVVRSDEWHRTGGWSVKATLGTSTTSGDLRRGNATTMPFSGVDAGKTYTVSAYINILEPLEVFSTAAGSRQLRILAFTSVDGSTYTQLFGPQGNNVAGVQRLSNTFTIPQNATGAIIALGRAGSSVDAGKVIYYDDVMVEEGVTLKQYFNGSTIAGNSKLERYRWAGAANNSLSVYETRTVVDGGGGSTEGYKFPFPRGGINFGSYFGHSGVDWPGGGGLAIKAIGPGVVVERTTNTVNNPNNFNEPTWRGCSITIDHGTIGGVNIRSLYAHMVSAPVVQLGDTIVGGQTLGYVGQSGAADGVHLHHEIIYNGVRLPTNTPNNNTPGLGFTRTLDWLDANTDGSSW